MNQCADDKKKSEKEKEYKNVFEISFSTLIIVIIIIIIVEKNQYENCVHHLKNFDCLFICFVEFFDSLSFSRKEN
jgi:hypothetical protein